MTTLFVRHQVADYDKWRRVYDDFDPTRKTLGVTDAAVFQSTNDANEVTVTHEFASFDAAQAFADSSELRTTMHAAGVVGAPTIWFTERR